MDDHGGVLAQLGRGQIHLQQLGRAAYAAQRVFDLMRQIANQLFVRLRLFAQPLFAVLAGLLLQRPHLDQHVVRAVGQRYGGMYRQGLKPWAQQVELKAQGCKIVVARPTQSFIDQRWLGDEQRKLAAINGATRLAQRIFQRGIGKADTALRIHHGNERAKQIQRLIRQAGFVVTGA